MSYQEGNIIRDGANNVSSLNGVIRLEENRGRLVVYDSVTKQERTVLDAAGTHYKDPILGTNLVDIGKDGLTLFDGTNNRLAMGRLPDNDVNIAISIPGEDVLEAI